MALKDVVKVNRKTFLDPRSWIGYDSLKTQTNSIWDLMRGMFTPARPTRTETFEAAMKRLDLTEKDLKATMQTYRYFLWIFLALSGLSLLFGIFLLIAYLTFAGFILGCVVSIFFLSQAFRYSFWLFQMKNRKLGCTFEEWRQGKLLHK